MPDQALDGDQPRLGTRWRVLSSPHFDVVFPAGLETDAQRVAATLERLRAPLGKTMGVAPSRVTLTLDNQSTVSNGVTALSPRRITVVTTPPGFTDPALLGADDWLSLLAVHETRHATQFDRTRAGFTGLLRTAFGDAGALPAFIVTPGWMWEGDAVGTETALSRFGRGRLPTFDKEIRSLALDGRLPGYYEAMLGSFDHFFPSEYQLGYLLTTHLRRTENPEVVGRLFRRTAANAWNPFAFHFAMKRETGRTPSRVYDSTMNELTALWRQQLEGLALTAAARRSPVPFVYTNFSHPQIMADGSIVALRQGLADLREVVRVDSGSVTRLTETGPGVYGIRTGGTLVAWTQIVPDPRWGWSDLTEIRLLDAANGLVRSVGPRGRWSFPVPSPDGRRMAAVETKETGGSIIVLLDATTGARQAAFELPEREHATEPSWRNDGNALVLTRQGLRGKALTILDLGTGSFTDLVPYGTDDMTGPVFAGDHVVYSAPFSGIDNLFAINVRAGARYQVTSRRVGAYQPSVSADARRLVFADYTSDGLAVMEMPLDPARWTALDGVVARPLRYYEPLVAQEQFTLVPAEVAADTSQRYPVRPFGKLQDHFRIHSWFPVLSNGEYGAGIVSTDVLNRLATKLTARYNANEQAASVSAGASYGALYPIIETQMEFGNRSTRYKSPADSLAKLYSWREQTVEAGLRLPLTFSRGYWQRGVSLGAHVGYSDVRELANDDARPPGNGRFVPVTFGLQAANIHSKAARDLTPRWGQSLLAQYRYTPLGGDFDPRRLEIDAAAYLPAPARHHGLTLTGQLEDNTSSGRFRFSTNMTEARGYDFVFDRRMVKTTAEYALPLAYPECALGPVLYVSRITSVIFGDYFRSSGRFPARVQSSAGVELLADVVPLSFSPLRFALGVRVVRRFADGRVVFEPAVRAAF